MAKKCGVAFGRVICVENMTLFVLTILIISVGYLYYKQFAANSAASKNQKIMVNILPSTYGTATRSEVITDSVYVPPLNTIDVRGPIELPPNPVGIAQPGVPVNIRTSTANTPYRQMGILTKDTNSRSEPLILPLFGRNLLNGRDKWQYYTVANSGGTTFNAKLPISVNGRSCTSEYGCDGISNGDVVYVEGYNDTFRVTVYENATLSYIPY